MVITMLVIVTCEDIHDLSGCIERGKKWFIGMDKRYPLLLYRLELGKEWKSVKSKLNCGLDENITPPNKRLTP